MNISVFKTSVQSEQQKNNLSTTLNTLLDNGNWSFDLEDCDKVLRIESESDITLQVMLALQQQGFICEELQ